MDLLDSTKQCSRCKYNKNRSEFSLAKRSKDGLQAWCKSCDAAYKTDSGYTKRLQEYHCHRTGKIRGILCSRCNSALGLWTTSQLS